MTTPLAANQFQFLDPESILDSPDFKIVESFLKSTKRTEIGWHYIVDLTWIYSIVKEWPRSYQIIDAGGGSGPTQFMLAELGFNVTNIDLFLTQPNNVQSKRYNIKLRSLPSYQATNYVKHLSDRFDKDSLSTKLRSNIKNTYLWGKLSAFIYRSRHQAWRAKQTSLPVGEIKWIQANICKMPEIETGTFDALVSLSSLEHIPLQLLPNALLELNRVLKPQCHIAITTSGTDEDNSWFHEPSQGHCFSIRDLAILFQAQGAEGLDARKILGKYKNSDYLSSNLAKFYYSSVNNGMPLGKWHPRYFPVGIWH